jgi:hypothetical protein
VEGWTSAQVTAGAAVIQTFGALLALLVTVRIARAADKRAQASDRAADRRAEKNRAAGKGGGGGGGTGSLFPPSAAGHVFTPSTQTTVSQGPQ